MSIRDGLREVVAAAEKIKMTEPEFIRAIGMFAKRQARGEMEGWGLSGFAKHIDKFRDESHADALVYLVCEQCKAERRIRASARNDNRHCTACSGRLVLADQAGCESRDAWSGPSRSDMPTMQQLAEIGHRHADSNPSLAMICLAQLEAGAFRHAIVGK